MALVFFDQRGIHLQNVRNSERRGDGGACLVKQRVTFVDHVGLEARCIQHCQSARRKLAIIGKLVEFAAKGLAALGILDAEALGLVCSGLRAPLGCKLEERSLRIGIAFAAIGGEKHDLVADTVKSIHELPNVHGRALEAFDRYAPVEAEIKDSHEGAPSSSKA